LIRLLLVLVLSIIIFTSAETIQVSGYSFVGVTDNGVEFPILPINSDVSNSTGTGDSDTNGTATINGMGINSVIVQEEYDGRLVVGNGVIGEDVSLIPYLPVDGTTEFVALVESSDMEIIYQIPVLGEEYELKGNNLYKTNSPNQIIYSNSTTEFGANTISTNDDHIIVTGDGVTILEIGESLYGEEMYLDGDISEPLGSIKIVTSNYDLIDKLEYLYEFSAFVLEDHGYNIGELDCDYLGSSNFENGDYTWVLTYSNVIWTITTSTNSHDHTHLCSAGIPISSTSNVYVELVNEVEQETGSTWCDNVYPNGSCHYEYSNEFTQERTISSTNNELPAVFSMELFTTINADGNIMLDEIEFGKKYLYCYSCTGITNYTPEHTEVSISEYVYDTGVDYYTSEEFTGEFNTNVTFPNEKFYLMVYPDGGTISIRGTGIEETGTNLKITNLPANIPYQIEKDSEVIGSGVTSSAGAIDIEKLNVEEGEETLGGYLHLFPDSLTYRGEFSTVILDNLNGESIHVDSDNDLVYVVHAYAMIPTVGDVAVSDLYLSNDSETLSLDYLNKNYTNSENILVPIIPNYKVINFMVDDISISLSYSSILGGTGINIIEPSISTVNLVDYSSRILSAESTVGTTSYVIATTDGTVNAIVTETISGTVNISNTYYLEKIPPIPPVPIRRDPLSGWVDIIINGEFVESLSLGVNPYPDFTTSGTQSDTTATQSVSYSYPDYVVSGAMSIDVESGDFVEFYLYAKIHGDIDNYSVPSGYTLEGEKGTSTSTVKITQGSIITSE